MFKRISLLLTFLAAFTMVGFTAAPQAQAWRGYYYGSPYRAYYGPPRAYYYGTPYRAFYGPRVYRSYYAAPYYAPYYGPYYGPGPGVAVSVGY
jgi:hypothetical protein